MIPFLAATSAVVLIMSSSCRPAQSVAQTEEAVRVRLLDSLAAVHPCRPNGYRVLAPPRWSERHACAVAARGVQLLAASTPEEPEFAPSDTARIREVGVWRIQTCEIVLDSPQVPGRVTPVWYSVEIDVPQRPRFITVLLDASTLKSDDGVQTVHKAFDGTDTLVSGLENESMRAIGSPCG